MTIGGDEVLREKEIVGAQSAILKSEQTFE